MFSSVSSIGWISLCCYCWFVVRIWLLVGLGESVRVPISGVDLDGGPPHRNEIHEDETSVGGDLLDDGVQVLDDDTGDEMSNEEDDRIRPEAESGPTDPNALVSCLIGESVVKGSICQLAEFAFSAESEREDDQQIEKIANGCEGHLSGLLHRVRNMLTFLERFLTKPTAPSVKEKDG